MTCAMSVVVIGMPLRVELNDQVGSVGSRSTMVWVIETLTWVGWGLRTIYPLLDMSSSDATHPGRFLRMYPM
jgi:hypothetical protein